MKTYSVRMMSAIASGLLAAGATAAPPMTSAPLAQGDPALATRLQTEENRLRPQRAEFASHFRQAYARYPSIPAGTLEAIAYVQSRWMHLAPDPAAHGGNHHHMPQAYGVMGLYQGEGFADQVGEAARLLGVPASRVAEDPLTNVLGAAALLDREIRAGSTQLNPASDEIAPALMRYAGYSPRPGKIEDFARTSFAFDVLLAQDRGVDDRGIVVPERPVRWERAFNPEQLIQQRAPFVRLDVAGDRVFTEQFAIDPRTETLRRASTGADGRVQTNATDVGILSTDYGPAIWDPAHSSNYTASRSQAVSAVTIHTAQGSYAGTISWFKNSSANVSAHYVIRSSDGQVTQMVRHAHTAWHVGSHNSYTLGIEHEGYVNNSSWYTTAMYNASSALVRHFCASYSGITCASAYNGAASSGINVLPTSVKIKGHQHYSNQTHTDPGINWDWPRYYALLNPGSGGTTKLLDTFESSVGHFDTSPSYSGSTTGIAATSSATRDCSTRRNGNCSLRVLLKDNTASSADWAVRLLSASGSPSGNVALTRANGRVGFWVYSGGSGMSVAVGIDDSDGTERSVSRALAANTWTYVEWSLTDSAQWNAWVGNANGAITASSVHLDAIWLYRAQTAYDVNVYIDDVQIRN
ncbi:N-acetylmuramoyl-L-alanine amidase [Pseudoxanthomonas wuyuanensis]|uniref:N-acetylmuramoyl-L-alanine amidase n=1 Tax=Pseudoxanthomonas wuyuanensis TaxID=1073196 RepID=A0A286CWW9_9GAMM|nr:peptidoglycan recognition family protein [Pseudoxanthomonas wuyuanensis]SOD50879.1 N-acetylmuramoyl-L-alanine amidase [Pseudoxanthomonas wuyuanensis]